MLDEALAVRGRTRLNPEPRFQGRERAKFAEPGLTYDDHDGCEMGKPERTTVDPSPAANVSRDDGHEPTNDEQHHGEVHEKHRVGEKLVGHGGGSVA